MKQTNKTSKKQQIKHTNETIEETNKRKITVETHTSNKQMTNTKKT